MSILNVVMHPEPIVLLMIVGRCQKLINKKTPELLSNVKVSERVEEIKDILKGNYIQAYGG